MLGINYIDKTRLSNLRKEMKRYEINMVSKDNNTYQFRTAAKSVEDAVKNAENSLIKNGYYIYGYELVNVKEINE